MTMRAGHRGSRHPGITALALLVGSALRALAVARISHLGLASSLLALLTGGGGGGADGLYLAYVAATGSVNSPSVSGLRDEEAGQLRQDVCSQSETALRGLYPCSLPVHWRPADKALFDL